jgi:hypothetical protein
VAVAQAVLDHKLVPLVVLAVVVRIVVEYQAELAVKVLEVALV